MDDLRNERRAVVAQVRSLGMDAVYAEEISPNGETSWEVIEAELATCHICIVLSGDRYGWQPDSGHGASTDKSVTELEVDESKRLGLAILPFFKRIPFSTKPATPDDLLRVAFRKKLSDWATGHFRREFDFADELADYTRIALLDFLTDGALKAIVRRRGATTPQPPSPPPPNIAVQPGGFLFAGAGMSMAAGFPPAIALADLLAVSLGWAPRGAEILSRYPFADLAALAEARLGREALVALVRELMETPLPSPPTSAHLAAVQRFRTIVTTNYDLLFEMACERLGLRYSVNIPSQPIVSTPDGVTIFKLDGTIARPETLVLTYDDARRAQADARYWQVVGDLFQSSAPTIVGHSLRDETSRRLLAARDLARQGTYVTPVQTDLDEIFLNRFRLEQVIATAEQYFQPA